VTIGGLDLKEVNPDTLEVLKVPGLFVSGEALNVDGECGGFNLQWAWTSGYLAGTGAAMYLHNLLFSSEE
jgi:predicted flavoprotein YhiN